MRKRSKGGAWCRSISAALVSLLFFAVAAPASAAELYGLVVGIDDYVGEGNDLDGAANDAQDVSQSLTRAGAKEVIRLVNAEASKERIFAAWEDLTAKAQPGDTIVFTYAGHGSQEPEPKGRHDEADGLNENFLLGKFLPFGPGTKERILDDEMFEWVQEADKKGVKVVFVADSVTPAAWNGARPPPASASARWRRRPSPPTSFTFRRRKSPSSLRMTSTMSPSWAPSPRTKLTPEVTIDGRKRGALSWAFARALEGRADKDGDGQVSELELLGYVVPAVHAQVESQQTPQVLPLRARSVALLTLREGKASAAAPAGSDRPQAQSCGGG